MRFPYAAIHDLFCIISLHRQGSLKGPLTAKGLASLGIAAGNTSRVLQALSFLRWIDDRGYPTETLTTLAHASSADFPPLLARNIQDTYQGIFASIPDIRNATPSQLEEAFAPAYPPTQHYRMILLFRALCSQADLLPMNRVPLRNQKRAKTMLHELVNRLPSLCRWTKQEREQWLTAFLASLDLVVELDKEEIMSP